MDHHHHRSSCLLIIIGITTKQCARSNFSVSQECIVVLVYSVLFPKIIIITISAIVLPRTFDISIDLWLLCSSPRLFAPCTVLSTPAYGAYCGFAFQSVITWKTTCLMCIIVSHFFHFIPCEFLEIQREKLQEIVSSFIFADPEMSIEFFELTSQQGISFELESLEMGNPIVIWMTRCRSERNVNLRMK